MKKFSTRDLVLCAMFAGLLAVCSWISVPAAVPFTLQTFAVFLTLMLLTSLQGLLKAGLPPCSAPPAGT